MKWIALSAALLAAVPALAQEAPKGPCERGQSTVKLGALDLDEMRCEMDTLHSTVGMLTVSLAKATARQRLLEADLEAARKALAEAKKEPGEKPGQ